MLADWPGAETAAVLVLISEKNMPFALMKYREEKLL